MMTLADVVKLAVNAGLSADAAAYAAAIAMAESGLNPNAYNGAGNDNSYGLWQINMKGGLGAPRRKQFGITTDSQLFDPNVNARAMAIISGRGTNWTPWTTFTRGTYLAHLSAARDAAGSVDAGSVPQTTDVGLKEDFSAISKAAKTLSNPGTWKRVGLFYIGMLLLLIAIIKSTGDNKLSDTSKTIIKLAAFRKLPVKK